ncbi:MAG: hypothetical protein H8E38_06180 [SAR324 cluster bacterium]|nr:hypothetical protein [SAR324 cluster bacterium]MBL7034976.1 hypothetical protein [SAR324 cluster bacterium]
MRHKISSADRNFLAAFESCELSTANFHHREHLRLAYILLVQLSLNDAQSKLKKDLLQFLEFNGINNTKYHETLTWAWLLAVRHFMCKSEPMQDSELFMKDNQILLDKEIMYTHYTHKLINSELARKTVLEADLEPIPLYE